MKLLNLMFGFKSGLYNWVCLNIINKHNFMAINLTFFSPHFFFYSYSIFIRQSLPTHYIIFCVPTIISIKNTPKL